MPLRQINDTYHVSPQISADDIAEAQAAGVSTVICNRPDDENPPELQIAAMRAEVEAAGMRFVALPFNQMTLTPEIVAEHRAAIESAEGPVLAYCASGNRSTIVWALGEAERGAAAPEALIEAAARAGYDIAGMRPTLETLHARSAAAES